MNLQKVIADLVKAQNNYNSQDYANCFSETAVVFDEGKTHTGRTAIKNWIEKAAHEYKMIMKPLTYSETGQVLKAEIYGTFPGSPIVVEYQFKIENGEIQSLKII